MTELMSNELINELFDYFTALKKDGRLYVKLGCVMYRDVDGCESTGRESLKKIHTDMSKVDEPLFVDLTMMHYGCIGKQLPVFLHFIVDSIMKGFTRDSFIGLTKVFIKFINDKPFNNSDYECMINDGLGMLE
jgi:hypothetical protein